MEIQNVTENRRRFATLLHERKHEANVALEAANSEVLALRKELKHCREEAANTLAEAEVTVKDIILA